MFLRITPLPLIAGVAALVAALAIGAGAALAATGPVAADPVTVRAEIRPWIDTVTTCVRRPGASPWIDRPCLEPAHASWTATPALAVGLPQDNLGGGTEVGPTKPNRDKQKAEPIAPKPCKRGSCKPKHGEHVKHAKNRDGKHSSCGKHPTRACKARAARPRRLRDDP